MLTFFFPPSFFPTAKQPENLVLSFNVSVLGLTLLKNLSTVQNVRELSQNKRFASAVIEMFANSHQCGKSGECELMTLYGQHWEDISELWLLGMQCKYNAKITHFWDSNN